MKLTNCLLIILIGCILFKPNFKKESKTSLSSGIVLTNQYTETKTVKAIPINEQKIKQSTTMRTSNDSDGRNRISLSQNIRIEKNWYISPTISFSENVWGQNDIRGEISITRYWN